MAQARRPRSESAGARQLGAPAGGFNTPPPKPSNIPSCLQMVQLVPLLSKVDPPQLRTRPPPPKRLVQVEHGDVRKIRHAGHGLQEPEALQFRCAVVVVGVGGGGRGAARRRPSTAQPPAVDPHATQFAAGTAPHPMQHTPFPPAQGGRRTARPAASRERDRMLSPAVALCMRPACARGPPPGATPRRRPG